MKKSLHKLLAIAFSLTILFSSCSKAPDKILPKKDGLWTINYSTTTTVGTNSSVASGAYSAKFTDGTITITQGGFSVACTWSYDKKNKTVTVSYPGFPSQTYNVEEMKAKSEKWTSHTTETSGSITTTVDEIWTLTKV
ncbi:hypothetical protein LBMAG27_15830 [Bacteroidota bacterium]|nr:hypothetical protein LBMAG27_15830 [Bacteroidota bacterium]